MKNFEDLVVWQKAIDLVDVVYDIIDNYPQHQRFSLVQQMQRCAVSVPSNIAEGSERNSTTEFIRYLYIAKASLAELKTQLIISERRDFLSKERYEKLRKEMHNIDNMLYKLIIKLKDKR
jgi:four helix bundle protein